MKALTNPLLSVCRPCERGRDPPYLEGRWGQGVTEALCVLSWRDRGILLVAIHNLTTRYATLNATHWPFKLNVNQNLSGRNPSPPSGSQPLFLLL